MTNGTAAPPAPIAALAERCALHVQGRFGLRPDGTPETLPLLDHFIDAVVTEEARGAQPPPGHRLRAQLVPVFAPTLGACFGEVVRGHFASRWRADARDPLGFVLDFDRCLLRLSPFAAAAEAILREHATDGPAVLRPAPQAAAGLIERLAAAPGLPEDEFFTLCTRFEALLISAEWLSLAGDDTGTHGDEDYARAFGPFRG